MSGELNHQEFRELVLDAYLTDPIPPITCMTDKALMRLEQLLRERYEAEAKSRREATLHVCHLKDAVCGDRPSSWCDKCPKRPAAQTEREAFEAWARPNGYDLRRNDVLGHYSSIDTSRAWDGFRAGRASLPAPQQATPDLADGPARMHWTNWMPVKDALEYAYQKMGLEMVKTDAGAKYPNLHWNLAGLVREFVVAQQDAMFGKCQACGKNVGLLDQIKCLDCGTRLCEPCAKEHFGSDHGARAAASHSHPAPTTSGWVETSAPPQRLDWSDTQQATPERHLTVTTNQQGEAVMVSWQDDEHRILDVVWERKPATPEPVAAFDDPKTQVVYQLLCSDETPPPEQHWEGWVARRIVDALAATPEPVGEPVGTVVHATLNGQAKPWVTVALNQDADLPNGTKLFTRPAPGVPEGWRITDDGDGSITIKGPGKISCNVSDEEPYGARIFGDVLHALCRAMLAAAQAKGGEHARS